MPIWEAREKCPNGIYIKRDFRWYESLSRKLLEEVGQFSPDVEYYSIDEFFWRAEPIRGQTWQETAEAVRAHLKERVRVPVTVACARTRTLAKLFADTAKPFGMEDTPDTPRGAIGQVRDAFLVRLRSVNGNFDQNSTTKLDPSHSRWFYYSQNPHP